MNANCEKCRGYGWVCEQHPNQPHGHDGCTWPGDPCSCNPRQAMPPGFEVIADVSETVSIPSPNQIEDHRRHFELVQRARDATRRGQALEKAGRMSEAAAALDEAEAHMERANLIAERWKA